MSIKFQINQPLKCPPQTEQFIISYQDEDIYRYVYSQIKQRFHDNQAMSILIEQPDQWQELTAITQNYNLLQENSIYEIELQKSGLNIKSLPELTPLTGDAYVFKTTQFKHSILSTLEQKPHTVWIQAYNPQVHELWQWLQSQLTHVELDPSIKPWFIQQTAIQFRHCRQLVEKLDLHTQAPSVMSLEAFQDGLGVQHDTEWQPLIDAWMQGDLSKSMQKLKQALQSNQELTLLIWLLSRNLQVLLALKQNCQPQASIFAYFKIWPKQTNAFIQAQSKFSLNQLARLIHQIQAIENHLKSGLNKQVPLMLQQFFIQSYVKELE